MMKKIFVLFVAIISIIFNPTIVNATDIINTSISSTNISNTMYSKEYTTTKTINRSISVKGVKPSGADCTCYTSGDSIKYTATITQVSRYSYYVPGTVITAGKGFELAIYYESYIYYTINSIDNIPRYYACYSDCCGCPSGKGCCSSCSCGSCDSVPSTKYNDGGTLKDLNGNILSISSTNTDGARKLAEKDLSDYLNSVYSVNNMKNKLKVYMPDSNNTTIQKTPTSSNIAYNTWSSCTGINYTETKGDEPYYNYNREYWEKDLGWSEGKKAYSSCQFYVDYAFIDRETGMVSYSNNENQYGDTTHMFQGRKIFTPLDMHTGSFDIRVEIDNMSLLPSYFSVSDINDTLKIQVKQKYYNEKASFSGNKFNGYNGFVFYYRPIAESEKNGSTYSLDPFPNLYIPANFVKWLYYNGEIGDGSLSTSGLLNSYYQYSDNWDRMTNDYISSHMSLGSAEYFLTMNRNMISQIKDYNSGENYLKNTVNYSGESEFLKQYRNMVNRSSNTSYAKLGEVNEDDWKVLKR